MDKELSATGIEQSKNVGGHLWRSHKRILKVQLHTELKLYLVVRPLHDYREHAVQRKYKAKQF